MDSSVAVAAFVNIMMQQSAVLRKKAILQRRKAAMKRRKKFFKRQARERMLFAMTLSLAMLSMWSSSRIVWTKERSSQWWDRVVMGTFTNHDWLQNFRMSQETFLFICNELRSLEKHDTDMRKAIPLQQRIAIALWFLSTNSDYRTIGHLFGVSKATVCIVTKEVCSLIVDTLLPKYIRIPNGDSLKQVVEDKGFPQCVGAVDGSHIPIVSPHDCLADYFNRKGFHSIILQGVVNHIGLFIDIYVGWPGRVHDARVFANSTLFKNGQEGTLLPDWKQLIEGVEVPLVMLGDPAYPLLNWLMKAYPDTGSLTTQQKTFY